MTCIFLGFRSTWKGTGIELRCNRKPFPSLLYGNVRIVINLKSTNHNHQFYSFMPKHHSTSTSFHYVGKICRRLPHHNKHHTKSLRLFLTTFNVNIQHVRLLKQLISLTVTLPASGILQFTEQTPSLSEINKQGWGFQGVVELKNLPVG